MRRISRRRILKQGRWLPFAPLLGIVPAARPIGAAANALGSARPAGGNGATPQRRGAGRPEGSPDPVAEWRGYSSAAMELRFGPADASIDGAPRRRASRGAGQAGFGSETWSDLRAAPAIAEGAFPWTAVREHLQAKYADLRRHFVFEYYPWYDADPFRHWQQWHREPPLDIAATSMPALGPYDSRAHTVLEQHARWILEAGAGAVNLSWWGRGSYSDQSVHTVMDVMAAHDIKVTFHLEPYADDRGGRYASDIAYLLREFGERRGWDCMLLLEDGAGRVGPVFKSFRTILPFEVTDCHGVTRQVPDYTSDGTWAAQTDRVRERHRLDFDHVTLLADSLNMGRTRRGGFDGIAIYDNLLGPETLPEFAQHASRDGLVFSFNCNPGFDSIARRRVPDDSCYAPIPFHPPSRPFDWELRAHRERARRLANRRIRQSLMRTLELQTDATLPNDPGGFFLVYINSFNEWHEGHAFEPARDDDDLTDQERPFGYHNARRGDYRLRTLRRCLERVLPS